MIFIIRQNPDACQHNSSILNGANSNSMGVVYIAMSKCFHNQQIKFCLNVVYFMDVYTNCFTTVSFTVVPELAPK